MSALLIDEITVTSHRLGRQRPTAGRVVQGDFGSVPVRPSAPGQQVSPAAPVAGGVRTASTGLQLTTRGIAAVLALFAVLMVCSVVVVVTAFLAIPNTPVAPLDAVPAAVGGAPALP